ncbi:Hypothetical predicted protein, partial [Argonauta hians]
MNPSADAMPGAYTEPPLPTAEMSDGEGEEEEVVKGQRSGLTGSIQVGHTFDPEVGSWSPPTADDDDDTGDGADRRLDRNQEIRSRPPQLLTNSPPNTTEQVRRVRNPVPFLHQTHHIDSDPAVCAALSRYKYYKYLEKANANHNATDPTSPLIFTMPDHVVPPQFITVVSLSSNIEAKQGSLVTIFSLWNTMMGTSILSIPWALKMAGFANGVVLLIVMAALMCYSAYRIVALTRSMENKLGLTESFSGIANYGYLDFSDVCQHYLGKFGLYGAILCSLASLIGGMVVYWILMSNFLYSTVSFIVDPTTTNASVLCPTSHHHHHHHHHNNNNITTTTATATTAATATTSTNHHHHYHYYYDYTTTTTTTAAAAAALGEGGDVWWGWSGGVGGDSPLLTTDMAAYHRVWGLTTTVPVFLLLLLFPLLNFKSPTFFTRFNSLATISVTYLAVFTVIKATKWGINIDFTDSTSPHYSHNISPNMAALTGVAALAYFIHNCVLSILRSHKTPENGVRDLSIAFFLVCFTYLFIGVGLYMSFPLSKDCIDDNLLNNLPLNDTLAFAARLCMLLQMVAVFPLLIYVFRVQFFHVVAGTIYPGRLKVIALNLVMCTVSILFACFLPKIGKVIGFVGAFCGFSYALGFPFLIHLMSLYERHQLTWWTFVLHSGFIVLGLANFIGQFFVSAAASGGSSRGSNTTTTAATTTVTW